MRSSPSDHGLGYERVVGAVGAVALAGVVGACLGYPGAIALTHVVRGVLGQGVGSIAAPGWVSVAQGLLYASLTGVLATLVAWPVAWSIRDRTNGWIGFALAPLAMPVYLAYSGFGLLRSPGTWLGDLLLRMGENAPVAWPLVADRTLAIGSMVLWVWPIACLVLVMALRRVDPMVWEVMRLEPMSRLRRLRARVGATRAGLLSSVAIVGLIMLGTVVPFQLAQFRTYAIELWATLAATPAEEIWKVYGASWPLVVVALVAGGVVLTGLARLASRQGRIGQVRVRRGVALAPIVAIALSIGAPALLVGLDLWQSAPAAADDAAAPEASHVESVASRFRVFIRLHGEAMADSWRVGVAAAGGALVIGLVTSLLLYVGGVGRVVAHGSTWILLAGALVPGVLLGSAMLGAYLRVRWLVDSQWIVVLGHLGRFGFITPMVASWLAASTAPERLAMRRLDGAGSFRAWVLEALPGHWVAIAAGAVVVGALSLQEIESTIMLAPAGTDSLARRMLELLHYARRSDLAVGTLIMLAFGFGSGLLILLLGALVRFGANRSARFPIT